MPLPQEPCLPAALAGRLAADYERFRAGLPMDPHAFCLHEYGLDIAGEYGGRRVTVPFGKASGQLSLNVRQVERDAEAGLGFVVLKTLIAQDEHGSQGMAAWATDDTHMLVEEIVGPRTGRTGWTVTWKGRGWGGTFEEYLDLLAACLQSDRVGDMPVAVSVKYHLPTVEEPAFRDEEYRYTTTRLQERWHRHRPEPMLLEKDFSPTLAGDERSGRRAQVLGWLRDVPAHIRAAAPRPLTLGVKVMNCLFEDSYQSDLLAACAESSADYLVYANRLFDPARCYEGKQGVAYGGPDLSDRNLTVLTAARSAGLLQRMPPLSGTGNIIDGRTAVEYALAGCTSFQMHTVFQLPDRLFDATMPNKSARVLHRLLFHPSTGLLAWLLHLREARGHRTLLGLAADAAR